MKRIVLTGGGTAGHVTPNIAILPELKKNGYEIFYIGSKTGMEKDLIKNENIPYYGINSGKLRRYIDFKNLTDSFRVVRGFNQAVFILKKLKPDVVFSKGGFVSCPVVWAAWINRIPVIIHESDMTPGLANKLSMPFASKICYTFPETKKYIPENKGHLTGIPVRSELKNGNAETGRKICSFSSSKPVIVVIGGSQGSGILNKSIRDNLDLLLNKFQICHICGRDNTDKSLTDKTGYKQFEYVSEELPHIFACADLIVSRAGATVLFEVLSLKKPNLLIPLSKLASRGDQILNAQSFEKQGFSRVLMEEDLNNKTFVDNINKAYADRNQMINAINSNNIGNSVEKVINIIENSRKK
jgi:UDP-N-acetylglucosamine--N-acetylmuramyl-(pentapeptide) pyrophosphoryl-undecaprenol N-acetylglucosamine transferase